MFAAACTFVLTLIAFALASGTLSGIIRAAAPRFLVSAWITLATPAALWAYLLEGASSLLFGVLLLVVLRRAARDHELLAAAEVMPESSEPRQPGADPTGDIG